MNKIFKVIGNKKALEAKKVVSELASANVASSDERASLDSTDKLADSLKQFIKQSLCVMMSSSLIFQSSYADIVADANAPTNQQATILNTASGATQVNIQTPTSGGISVNQYSEFNTGENGTILNNSRNNVQTQSAGWVEGNPWLAGGEAKAIVNQVNSNDPSMLKGTIEVAGSRADVIIANPSGISVDGASILNSSGTTLTTGKVNMSGGAIESYSVDGGKITIEGAGLNDSGSDYTHIISRANEINANIHASDLKIIAGTNEVSADTSTITKKAASTPAPSVAIDTKALGGMYAGQITLVSTEEGVGVNNAGVVNANNFTLSSDGKLTNSGTIAVNNRSDITVKTLENSHAITSNENIKITADTLNNSGTISALRELKSTTDELTNSGKIQAARLDITSDTLTNSEGTIAQAGGNSLEINAHKLTNTNGALLGSHEEEPLVAGEGDTTTTESGATVTTDTVDASSGTTSSTSDPLTPGSIAVSGELLNDGGEISGASVALGVSDTLSNTDDSLINVANLEHTGTILDNQNSKIMASGISALSLVSFTNLGSTIEGSNFQFNATSFDNTEGSILGDTVGIEAQSVINKSGTIQSSDTLAITTTGGSLDNTGGTLLSSGADVSMDIDGDVDNTEGTISAATTLDAKAYDISNDAGVMQADEFVNIKTTSLHNAGDILSGGDMSVSLENESTNEGTLSAAGDLVVETTAEFTNSAVMSAVGTLGFLGGSLTNSAEGEISGESVDVETDTLTNRGVINSNTLTWLKAGTLNNIGTGAIYGDTIIIDADTLLNTSESVDGITKSAVIAARELLNIGAQNITNSEGAELLSLGTLNIGGSIDEWGNVAGKATVLDNLSARIESGGDMYLGAQEINNLSSEEIVPVVEIKKATLNFTCDGWDSFSCSNAVLPLSIDLMAIKEEIIQEYADKGIALSDTELQTLLTERMIAEDERAYIMNMFKDTVIRSQAYYGDLYYNQLLASLDSNEMIIKRGKPHKKEEYRGIDYTITKESVDQETLDNTKPAEIISGGNLLIEGETLLNKYSNIIATKAMDITASVSNISLELVSTIVATADYSWKHKSDGGQGRAPTTKQEIIKTSVIASKIIAGGALTGSFGTLQNGMESDSDTIYTSQIATTEYTAYQGTSNDIEIREASPNLALPTSSLFSIDVDDSSSLAPYITTDPRFTNYSEWLSSDYMISALGLDPTNMLKRLGDGYYELRLIKDQIAQLTGKRFLDGYGSDIEQYQALMDAGVTYAQAFGLTPGVALSAAQVAQLTSDMVWLVEEQVTLADGSTVTALVPKVYVVAKSGDLDGSGALISANSMNLTVDTALNNSGKMYASNDIVVDAGSIVNNQGSIKAEGVVDFVALNDISNLSGSISGDRGVSLVSTEGSVINQTLVKGVDVAHESGIEHYSIVGEKASITSEGGNIVINAAKNIENIGADISATTVEDQDTVRVTSIEGDTQASTGGNISLSAGEEIIIGTAQDERDYDYINSNAGYTKGKSVVNIGSSVEADGVIVTQSGSDTTIQGSSVDAGSLVSLNSDANINIEAVNDVEYSDHKFVSKGLAGSKKTNIDTIYKEEVVGSTITGENISINSQDDINIKGSTLHAKDNIQATTQDGDINIYAQTYSVSELHMMKKKGFGGLKQSASLNSADYEKLQESLLKTDTAQIVLNSGNNINIIASDIESASDIQLKALNELNILAGEEASTLKSEHKKTSFDLVNLFVGLVSGGLIPTGPIYEQSIHNKGNYDTTAKSSNLQASGNIIADTGTTNVMGSNLEAQENIVIKADTGEINIVSAQELQNATSKDKEIEVSMSNMIDMTQDLIDKASSGEGESSIKIPIATATLDETEVYAQGVTNKSSSLNAKNGSVVLDSFSDINVEGSNIVAGDTIAIQSTIGDITVKNALDSEDRLQKEKHGEATVSATVRNEYVEIATAIKELAEAAEQLKDVKKQYSNYKKELKKLKNTLTQIKVDYKNGAVGVDYEDIEDLEDLIDNVGDQEKYHIASLAAASANVASRTLALTKQIATAAASSGTWGFNVGIALDVEGSKTRTETSSTTAVASNLYADNIYMLTDQENTTAVNIQGSNVIADNLLGISTHNLNVTASQDTYHEEQDTEDISGSISMTVYGAATGPNVSLGYGEQHISTDVLQNNNAYLNADNMVIDVANDASFNGATVRADNTLDMDVGGDLNVESVRDEYSSNSHGYNVSAGISFGSSGGISGGNAGAGTNNGTTVSKEVVLTSITAGEADITVGGNTNLKGSLIAAGTFDEEGNFVDNGNLDLQTDTLTFSNLSSSTYSTSNSIGGGVSLNQNLKTGETLPNASSVTYSASDSMSYSKTKTLATVGSGTLTLNNTEDPDELTRLNRDVDTLNKKLYEGGVSSSVDALIDTRVLSEDGRKDIKEDIEKSKEFLQDMVEKTGVAIEEINIKLVRIRESVSEEEFQNIMNYLETNPDKALELFASNFDIEKELAQRYIPDNMNVDEATGIVNDNVMWVEYNNDPTVNLIRTYYAAQEGEEFFGKLSVVSYLTFTPEGALIGTMSGGASLFYSGLKHTAAYQLGVFNLPEAAVDFGSVGKSVKPLGEVAEQVVNYGAGEVMDYDQQPNKFYDVPREEDTEAYGVYMDYQQRKWENWRESQNNGSGQ